MVLAAGRTTVVPSLFDVLRLVGADEPGKRWLLKNPGHVAEIDCLFEVMPDACVIQTHRDPVKAIPSLCSTLHMAQRMFEGDAVRPESLGAREIEYWGQAMEKTARARDVGPSSFMTLTTGNFTGTRCGSCAGSTSAST